jgi:hypothetical protein
LKLRAGPKDIAALPLRIEYILGLNNIKKKLWRAREMPRGQNRRKANSTGPCESSAVSSFNGFNGSCGCSGLPGIAGPSQPQDRIVSKPNGTSTAVVTDNGIFEVTGSAAGTTFRSDPTASSILQQGSSITVRATEIDFVVNADQVMQTGPLGLAVSGPSPAFAPTALVDVRGPPNTVMRIVDGNQSAGLLLTSDASGFAHWAQPEIGSVLFSAPIHNFFLMNLTTPGTQYIVAPPSVLGPSNGFTSPGNGRIVYAGLATQIFFVTMVVSIASAAAQEFYLWPYLNGSYLGVVSSRVSTTEPSAFVQIAVNFTAVLAPGYYLDIYLSNETLVGYVAAAVVASLNICVKS